MKLEFRVKARDLKALLRLPDNIEKGSLGLLDDFNEEVSRTLKGNILTVLSSRYGYTKELTKYNMWSVTSKKRGNKGRTITIETPLGYAGYLNNPNGPYPLPIDRGKLRKWMSVKGYTGMSVSELVEQITSSGHQTKRGEAFMEEAVFNTMIEYERLFATQVSSNFQSLFK